MPRTGRVKTRQIDPDPLYKNRVVAKLINVAMRQGKKSVVQKHVYGAFEQIKKEGKDPIEILQLAIENVEPTKKVRPRRVGGASYLVPVPVKGNQRQSLAIRWLIEAANARSNAEYKTFSKKLAAELLAAAVGKGGSVEKKHTIHKVAEANKAFAHFRW